PNRVYDVVDVRRMDNDISGQIECEAAISDSSIFRELEDASGSVDACGSQDVQARLAWLDCAENLLGFPL
ncbi:MAG: hypothetical protein M3125_06325, partial [Gemmatimonadota bacterium]|nr:hypothetical protein [Gemmatimonadota bacterium]